VHGEDFVQRSKDLATNGISGDGRNRNIKLWKRRTLPDCSISHAVAIAGAKPGTDARAGTGTGSGPCSHARPGRNAR